MVTLGIFWYALECGAGVLRVVFFLVEPKLKPALEHYQKPPACQVDPCPPSVSSLHTQSTPGKSNRWKLHCNKHNAHIPSRNVMDFSILPSFHFTKQKTYPLRPGLSGRVCGNSHDAETTTKIPSCVPNEWIWKSDPNIIEVLGGKHFKNFSLTWLGFALEVWTMT